MMSEVGRCTILLLRFFFDSSRRMGMRYKNAPVCEGNYQWEGAIQLSHVQSR